MKAHSWKTPKDLSIIGGPTPSRLTAQNLDSFPPRSPNVTASLLRGGYSSEACHHDSFDYDALRQVLLDPLGPGRRPRVPSSQTFGSSQECSLPSLGVIHSIVTPLDASLECQ
jgi:hypothetical protein